MNADKEAVLRRVQKLLAIAQDSRANPNEAMAAASQAEKLMRKFEIDHSDLVERELRNNPSVMTTGDARADAITNGTKAKVVPPWASWLGAAVADYIGVGATTSTNEKFGKCIRFYGYDSDVQIAVWLMEYFVKTINRLSLEYRETATYAERGRAVLTDYRKGIVIGIRSKITAAIQEREAEQRAQAAAAGALVLLKQQRIQETFGPNVLQRGQSSKRVAQFKNSDVLGEGLREGRNIDIKRRGINNEQEENLKIK